MFSWLVFAWNCNTFHHEEGYQFQTTVCLLNSPSLPNYSIVLISHIVTREWDTILPCIRSLLTTCMMTEGEQVVIFKTETQQQPVTVTMGHPSDDGATVQTIQYLMPDGQVAQLQPGIAQVGVPILWPLCNRFHGIWATGYFCMNLGSAKCGSLYNYSTFDS